MYKQNTVENNEIIWKEIEGYEGHYQVSNTGLVKSIKKKKRLRIRSKITATEILLRPKTKKNGYLEVSLCLNAVTKSYLVHRLVAIHFIPNPYNKPDVNHKFGDKKSNNVSDLEWVTEKENTLHGVRTGLIDSGANHYAAKTVINTATGDVYGTMTDAAKAFGMPICTLSAMLKGRLKNKTSLARMIAG